MSQPSEETIALYRDSFSTFDKNGDGTISSTELASVVRGLGREVTDTELEKMVASVDKDHNGTIDFDEFLELMQQTRDIPQSPDDELLGAFQVFDKNGDGTISVTELSTVMMNLGENLNDAEIEQMIQEADLDGDHVINFDEFKRMVTGRPGST